MSGTPRVNLDIWQHALERRKELSRFAHSNTTLRILHREDPAVRLDRFGETGWYYWYHESPPSEAELKMLRSFSEECGTKNFVVRHMKDRGLTPIQQSPWVSSPITQWTAEEHGIQYLLKANQGLSPGLFLDQCNNRKWVLDHSDHKKVLNLFCYTAGFGLCAAKGESSRSC